MANGSWRSARPFPLGQISRLGRRKIECGKWFMVLGKVEVAKCLHSTVVQSRLDLGLPLLKWYVSQQSLSGEKNLSSINITEKN